MSEQENGAGGEEVVAPNDLRGWLGSFTGDDPMRPDIAGIWRTGEWLCASNGHVLVAIPDDDGEAAEPPQRNPTMLARTLEWLTADELLHPRELAMVALREWCGPLTTQCGECGQPRPEDLTESSYDLSRLGRIGGTVFNLRLLGHVLKDAPGDTVVVSEQADPEHAIHVRGDGWRALVMPLRKEAQDRDSASDIDALAPAQPSLQPQRTEEER